MTAARDRAGAGDRDLPQLRGPACAVPGTVKAVQLRLLVRVGLTVRYWSVGEQEVEDKGLGEGWQAPEHSLTGPAALVQSCALL